MSLHEACVEAALWGPELRDVKLNGFRFHIHPIVDRSLDGDLVHVSGRLSHCKIGFDDRIDYRIVVGRGQVIQTSRDYDEHHLWTTLVGTGGAIAGTILSVFVPPVGAPILAASATLLTEGTHKLEGMLTDDYRVVADNLIVLIAVALAMEFGRSAEWAPARVPPPQALEAGHVTGLPPLYIGRAKHAGNLHPGKIAFSKGAWHCYIGNGGVEQAYDAYEVFVGAGPYHWVAVHNTLPEGAVQGGLVAGDPMFLGRANHVGNVHPGKVAFHDGAWRCFIGNGGVEQMYDSFEVLVRG
jgi:hypothetical protein